MILKECEVGQVAVDVAEDVGRPFYCQQPVDDRTEGKGRENGRADGRTHGSVKRWTADQKEQNKRRTRAHAHCVSLIVDRQEIT